MKNQLIAIFLFVFKSSLSFSQGSWKLIDDFNTTSSVYGIDMSFVNDSVGYLADNLSYHIYKTTDKGETWNSVATLGGNLRSIEFVNDTLGFVGLLSTSSITPGAMYRTINGGTTWTQLTNMQMSTFDGICGIEKNGNTVVATGTFSGPPFFYRSDDFGNTWSKLDLSALSSGLIDCFMYNSDTILVSGVADSTTGYQANILKSTDGGLTWQQVFVASKSSTSCWKLFMRPSGKGIASIQNYLTDTLKAAITNDFGDTWQEVEVAPPLGVWMAGVCFFNDTLGWISSEYTGPTFETNDGGMTWSGIPLVSGVNRFVVLDSATVMGPGSAAGHYAVVFKYDNSISSGMEDIIYQNQNEGYALNIFPNPAKNSLTIEAVSKANTVGILRIVDANGNLVMNLTKQYFINGKTTLNHPIDLPSGHYYMVWLTNNMNIARPFDVLK